MATVTGSAGTSIGAQCTVPDYGAQARSSDWTTAMTSVCNDIATIKSGNCTIAGVKTFSGACIFSTTLGAVLKVPEIQFNPAPSITRTGYSTPVNQADGVGGSWAPDATTGQWTDSGTGSVLKIPVDLPNGAILNTVHVYIAPATGLVHGGVPTVGIALKGRTLATNGALAPASTGGSDTSASEAAYETPHSIDLTLTGGLTINRATSAYTVHLTGEQGGHAHTGLVFIGVSFDYSAPVDLGID